MPTIFDIPKLNPLRAMWQNFALQQDAATGYYNGLNPSFNQKDFDKEFYLKAIRSYEDVRGYVQPFQQSDTIVFQWLSEYTTTGHFSARLLTNDGDTFIDKTLTITQISGTYNSLKAYRVNFALYDLPEGKYFLQIEYNGGGSSRYYVITEPFHVKQIHANTVRIDYWNSFNDFSYVFESGIIPQLRVHGCISEVATDAKFKVYEDQPLNLEMVSGVQFRNYMLVLGMGKKDIPEWMAERVDCAMLCDTTEIDGHDYTRAEGSKMEGKKADRIPVNTYTLKLRDRYNLNTLTVNTSIIVGDVPQTEHFWVELMVLHGVSTNIRKGFNGARNFLDYLNSSQLTTYGYWTMREDYKLLFIYYVGQTSGGAITLVGTNILPYGIRLRCQKYSTNDYVEFTITSISTNLTYAVVKNGGLSAVNKTTAAGPITISATYTDLQKHDLIMYFDSSSCKYIAESGATTLRISQVTGDIPPSCLRFNISTVAVGLTTIGNLFRNVTALDIFNINGQNLPTFGIDKLIMHLYENRSRLSAGCVVTLTQTPAAAPSNTPGIADMKSAIRAVITTLTTD